MFVATAAATTTTAAAASTTAAAAATTAAATTTTTAAAATTTAAAATTTAAAAQLQPHSYVYFINIICFHVFCHALYFLDNPWYDYKVPSWYSPIEDI